jgi:hypothetical protein
MTASINASTSSGIVQTADTSGSLALQSDGTTKLTVSSTGVSISNLTATGTFGGGVISSGTAQASTSGTSITFTGIPSWVKRITVMFNGVSTNGTSEITFRAGSGSIEITGYTGTTASTPNATASTVTSWSTGATIISSTSSANLYYGSITMCLLGSNTWSILGTLGRADTLQIAMGGSKVFSGVIDRVVITTVTGTDTFDAGLINILYEG